MANHGGVGGSNNVTGSDTQFIPLQFWFCRNPGLALPLIALQYHEVKVIIQIEQESLLADDTAAAIGTFKLWVDYIYLDTDERRFAQQSHEYLIEQVQIQSFLLPRYRISWINFNHPVKELMGT